MNKKNVALIIPSLRGGGAERMVSRLSLALNKDYNVLLIVFNNKSPKYEVLGEVIDFKIPSTNNMLLKLFYFFKKIIYLKKAKKLFNIDVSISFMEGPNIINILSKKNDKIYISVRNLLSKSSKGWEYIYLPFVRLLYNRADKIISVSKTVKNDLINNFNIKKSKIKNIYNFIDFKKIKTQMKLDIDILDKDIYKKDVIINIGRLTKQKGQIHLIKAFKHINLTNPNINLVILGDGELYDELKKLVKELNLEKNVFLLGFKDNPYRYLYRSKLYVNTSLYEGFGNVLLEAMCCELPVIAANCPSGINEIISPDKDFNYKMNLEYLDFGIITSGFNNSTSNNFLEKEKVLAYTILDLLSNKEKYIYYKNKSIDRTNDFTCDKIIKQWIDLIG